LIIFGTYGTPVAFDTLRYYFATTIIVYYTSIIPSEFWHICYTLVHLTFGTPVGTLYQLVSWQWFVV